VRVASDLSESRLEKAFKRLAGDGVRHFASESDRDGQFFKLLAMTAVFTEEGLVEVCVAHFVREDTGDLDAIVNSGAND
jgi:hypothetical protein